MARATHVKKARKDYPDAGIKKGDEYWHWAFMSGGRGGPPIRSKTPPRRSQLTQSSFKSTLYEIQDNATKPDSVEDLEGARDSLRDELSSLKDDTEGNLEAMPDGLKEGDSGQMLQTRVDSLDEVISTLENVDCEFDPDECPTGTDLEEYKAEWLDEKWQEIDSALNEVDEG